MAQKQYQSIYFKLDQSTLFLLDFRANFLVYAFIFYYVEPFSFLAKVAPPLLLQLLHGLAIFFIATRAVSSLLIYRSGQPTLLALTLNFGLLRMRSIPVENIQQIVLEQQNKALRMAFCFKNGSKWRPVSAFAPPPGNKSVLKTHQQLNTLLQLSPTKKVAAPTTSTAQAASSKISQQTQHEPAKDKTSTYAKQASQPLIERGRAPNNRPLLVFLVIVMVGIVIMFIN